ncbi:MAG: flagellar hook-basal body complex protein [Chitinispirillales bacterium]|jgi:flagellar hook protein FlgE|nr:flagellar hook-basal body complex protein [Chitinispirillales bacterium]
MIRSLYSGISGLRTHQVGLDVTANNIANVNTVAFKAGRAAFKESMVQMLQGPSRPAGNAGGINPMQIGLGVAVGSIDTMLRQGNMQTTGQITDLALEGRAYFVFSNGSGHFYSRNGGLQLDAEGRLVSPTNGWRLQGKMADAHGNFGPDAMIGDIRIPWGDKAPAKATDMMVFSSNLNSDSQALGTVTHTHRFLASAGTDALPSLLTDVGVPVRPMPPTDAGDEAYLDALERFFEISNRMKLTDLFNSNGDSLGIIEGDTLTFRVADANIPTFSFRVEKYEVVNEVTGETTMQMPTLYDFAAHLQAYLREHVTDSDNVEVRIGPDGGLQVINDSGEPINGLSVTSSRPGSRSFVANAFLFPATISTNRPASGTPGDPGYVPDTMGQVTYTSPGIRIPAVATDSLRSLFDASGNVLGFTDGDTIEINGQVGGRQRTVRFTFYDGEGTHSQAAGAAAGLSGPVGATTMEDLIIALGEAFNLPPTDGTIYQRQSVYLKSSTDLVNDGIPVGAIVMRGQPELAFALTALKVVGQQFDVNQQNSPARFTSNMTFTSVQDARNTGVHRFSDIIYDDSGAQHNVSISFTHTGTPGEWLWEITLVGGEQVILGGNRGRMTFLDGTPSSFTFDDMSNEFRFDPRNGASEVSIRLDTGEPGSLLGITQFEKESTTAVKHQNGYGMGKLQEITISETGEITGLYTNGISKAIAQIYVAEFNNPAGLLKMGDSMFSVSNNSGHAALYQPGVGSTTKVKPGALEMSNVELETEFTNMITIQRGYQASARVVSTSDQMLQELVQLVR